MQRIIHNTILFFCCVFMLSFVAACKNGGADNTQAPMAAPNKAIAELNQQIEESPENAALYFQRGRAYVDMEMDSVALIDFKKAAQLDSTKAVYFSTVGDMFFRNRDVSSSIPWFKKAAAIDPEDKTVHLNFAKVLLFAKDFPEAFKEINFVLRKDVYNPEAYLLKGMIYKEMKDTGRAISSFQTALQVAPDFKDAMIQLGQIYRDKNDPVAFTYYENAFKTDTTDVFPLYAIGTIYQDRKEYEKAKEVYARMLTYDMQSADALYNTGFILMHQDSLEKAQRMFERVTKIEPDNANAYYNKGLVYEMMGKKEEALHDYEQALIFDNKNEVIQTAINRVKK